MHSWEKALPGEQSFEAREALANAWGALGDVKIREGVDAESIVPYQHQLQLRTALARENRDETAGQRGISLAETKLGDTLVRIGHPDQALPHLMTALAIDRRLSAKEPQNALFTRKLYVTNLLLGSALSRNTSRHLVPADTVTGYLEAATSLADKMAAADPDNRQSLLDIAIIGDDTGDWLRAEKHPAEAMVAYRRAAAALEKLNRISPEAPGNRGMLVEVYQRMGGALTDAGQFAEAAESLRMAQQHLARAEQVNPGLAVNTSRRAEVQQTRAQLFAAQKHWKEAIAAYRDTLAILESQHRLIPDNQQFLDDQPALYGGLADSCEAAGLHEEALHALHTALDRYREIEAKRALVADEAEDRKSRTFILASWENK